MVNVREIMAMDEVKKEVTMVKEQVPDASDAWARLKALEGTLEALSDIVNETDVNNTEESWHLAYAKLTTAFRRCMKEEKKIIAE